MIEDKQIYSYKRGFSEGVVFAFFDGKNILIEHRPNETIVGGEKEIFFTNGSIEMKDHDKEENYIITALKREINEEFDGKVIPIEFHFLGELEVPEINALFYVYLISKWEGSMPAYTIEEGKKFADLEWVNLQDRSNYFKYESAFTICKMIDEHLTDHKKQQNSMASLPKCQM